MSDAGQYTAVAGGSISTANLYMEGRHILISKPISTDIQVFIYLLFI